MSRRFTDPSDANYPAHSSLSSSAPHHDGLIRRTSSKRTRGQRTISPIRNIPCNCPLPDRPKQGQKLLLHRDIPPEILLEVFQYALMWPPVKLPKCEHQLRPPIRRATTGDAYRRPISHRRAGSSAGAASSSSFMPEPEPEPEQDLSEDSEEAGKFGINMLLKIAHTCKRFYDLLPKDDPWIDETFWSVVAHRRWGHLPDQLKNVQGRNTLQTSWRNVVSVFMRSENGQFSTKKGAKGGVDCFGGKKACHPASLWNMEKIRRSEIAMEGERQRSLLLACAQPGPNTFTVTPDEDTKSWTVALSLQGGEYLVYLDEYGRFGQAGKLADNLERSDNIGYFVPDIFQDKKDRFRLVKVQVRKELQAPRFPTRSQGVPIQEVVTWDLSSIPEYVADPKAHVARCTSYGGVLLCSLFTNRNPTELEEFIDPPEDCRLFCVEAKEQTKNHLVGIDLGGMSSKKRGKLPENQTNGTVFRWQREFEYRDPAAYTNPDIRRLHYVLCNIRMNATVAVALVRWNESTETCLQQLFDREFHVLNPITGESIRVLVFPNLYWDFRHHDMDKEYNLLRVKKLKGLYNPPTSQSMGAGNRTTRIHEDAFFLTDKQIISGSHDYCNWVWDLHGRQDCKEGVYTEDHNDGGIIPEPFDVLDDYYWNSAPAPGQTEWEPRNERAGWWVKTPNQILCFWHGVAMDHRQERFAVCRPGKMFVWDLNAKNEVRGYTNLLPSGGERQRWLGKLKDGGDEESGTDDDWEHGEAMNGWYVCDNVMPEEGLWLLYDDTEAVFIDRKEILEACGLAHEQWGISEDKFSFWKDGDVLDVEMEDGGEDEAVEVETDMGKGKGKEKRRRISYELEGSGEALWDGDID
ncbi:hypothetical protein K440DRAFT_141386 [Wilcoxina mikolae CBS 423.85]|nr:hypothetical protein K440DRAFT_141386 [Wilcoxina mikolae CBS 423.85]